MDATTRAVSRSRDERFAAASRRWLIRFIAQTQASIGEVLLAGASLSERATSPGFTRR